MRHYKKIFDNKAYSSIKCKSEYNLRIIEMKTVLRLCWCHHFVWKTRSLINDNREKYQGVPRLEPRTGISSELVDFRSVTEPHSPDADSFSVMPISSKFLTIDISIEFTEHVHMG